MATWNVKGTRTLRHTQRCEHYFLAEHIARQVGNERSHPCTLVVTCTLTDGDSASGEMTQQTAAPLVVGDDGADELRLGDAVDHGGLAEDDLDS
jgi:hypothetical protein